MGVNKVTKQLLMIIRMTTVLQSLRTFQPTNGIQRNSRAPTHQFCGMS